MGVSISTRNHRRSSSRASSIVMAAIGLVIHGRHSGAPPPTLNRAQETMTKTIEECEREFTETVRAFIDTAIAGGHSLESAKAMARDVVAR